MNHELIVEKKDLVLITGANGFVGSRVVKELYSLGFNNLRCFVRPSSNLSSLNKIIGEFRESTVEIYKGTLLSADDCKKATEDVSIIIHLAAGIGKSFPDCYMNSVVTTRNLLEAIKYKENFKRFMNVSSFAVYSNQNLKRGAMLDESCEVDKHPELRGEAYAYGKARQDDLLLSYHEESNIPYVIVRPGVVFGPGNPSISPRVGIDTFGFFLHLGGSNPIPLTYVDNCAEAMVLASITKGVDGEVFNIVDDNLPTSREFLKMYKKNVRKFRSVSVPYPLFYFLNYLWAKYSKWSKGQLPLLFNRGRCAVYWKGNSYPNDKLKRMLGWEPKVTIKDALDRYFAYGRESREAGGHS